MLLSEEVTEAESSEEASDFSSFSTGLTMLLFRLRRKFCVREEMKMGAFGDEPPDTLGKLGEVLAKRNCCSLARCLSFSRAANESGLRRILDTRKLDKMFGTFSALFSSSSSSSISSSTTSSEVSFSTSSELLMTELLTRFADDDKDALAGLMEELTMLLLLLNKLAEARFL